MIGQMRRREQKGTGDQGQIMCNEYVFSITPYERPSKDVETLYFFCEYDSHAINTCLYLSKSPERTRSFTVTFF